VPAGERHPSLLLHGAGLRPYLSAYFVSAGQPFSLSESDRFDQQAKYLLASPTLAQLTAPEQLRPGAYDLYLYDEGLRVAALPSALEVALPGLPTGTMDVKVRFFVADETIPLIKVGDRDEPPAVGTNLPRPGEAVVTAVAVGSEKSDTLDMHLLEQDKEQTWVGRRVQGRPVDLTLRVPVLKLGHRSYQYTSADLPRAGDIFTLATTRYKLHGLVLWVSDVTENEPIQK
jgi:hypothetical protein